MTRNRILLALAITAIVALIAVAVAIMRNSSPEQKAAHPARPPAVSTTPTTPPVDLSQIRWASYHGYLLPETTGAGPANTAGGFASGYADTPLGALMAALNIAPRTAWQFGPAIFQPTIQDQVTGQYQMDLLSAALDGWNAADQQTPQYSSYARWIGFAWQSYTPTFATMVVVEGGTVSGTVIDAATEMQVQWADGDWELVAPPGGDWDNATTRITSLSGYTLFPGQGG